MRSNEILSPQDLRKRKSVKKEIAVVKKEQEERKNKVFVKREDDEEDVRVKAKN